MDISVAKPLTTVCAQMNILAATLEVHLPGPRDLAGFPESGPAYAIAYHQQ